MNHNQRTTLNLAALVCAVFFTLTIVFAHAVSESRSLISDTLSRYALDEYGIVLEIGFFAIGITQILLAYYLLASKQVKQPEITAGFFILAGIGVIAVALFPTAPPPATIAERLPHITGAIMQFLFFPLAVFVFAKKLKYNGFMIYTVITAMITAILFVIMLVLFVSPALSNFTYFGLIEKIDILMINAWLITMSLMVYQSKLALN